jgi:hypothetical protein
VVWDETSALEKDTLFITSPTELLLETSREAYFLLAFLLGTSILVPASLSIASSLSRALDRELAMENTCLLLLETSWAVLA